MTDRKPTCVACKSAITKGDIAGSDLEFGGELKATNQPTYAADMDTDFIATVGMLDEYTPMVRTTGNQTIAGVKLFSSSIIQLGSSSPTIKPGNDDKSTVPSANLTHNMILVQDDTNNNLAGLFSITGTDGKRHITAYVFDCDGTYRSQVIL